MRVQKYTASIKMNDGEDMKRQNYTSFWKIQFRRNGRTVTSWIICSIELLLLKYANGIYKLIE